MMIDLLEEYKKHHKFKHKIVLELCGNKFNKIELILYAHLFNEDDIWNNMMMIGTDFDEKYGDLFEFYVQIGYDSFNNLNFRLECPDEYKKMQKEMAEYENPYEYPDCLY